jgi:hypothetical protein
LLKRSLALILMTTALVALPAAASASQMIDRNARGVRLAVNAKGTALLTYRARGKTHHVLAWGAVNARVPTRGVRQVAFRVDYSGGWGSQRRLVWKSFRNVCGPYTGPELEYLVAACTAPDGSHWAVQKWRRMLPPYGFNPTAAESAVEMHLSHWSGELPEFVVKQDWVYSQRFDHLYGWLRYKDRGVYGFKSSRWGAPLDSWGRNIYVDTFNSAYGRGWKRENAFLTHTGSGVFCYGFFPHTWRAQRRPAGDGQVYRATVMGPGVTPILFWEEPALPTFDPVVEQAANEEQAQLFSGGKCRAK